MFNKHFFKFLIGFIGMIFLGLLGVLLINNFGGFDAEKSASPVNLEITE